MRRGRPVVTYNSGTTSLDPMEGTNSNRLRQLRYSSCKKEYLFQQKSLILVHLKNTNMCPAEDTSTFNGTSSSYLAEESDVGRVGAFSGRKEIAHVNLFAIVIQN